MRTNDSYSITPRYTVFRNSKKLCLRIMPPPPRSTNISFSNTDRCIDINKRFVNVFIQPTLNGPFASNYIIEKKIEWKNKNENIHISYVPINSRCRPHKTLEYNKKKTSWKELIITYHL